MICGRRDSRIVDSLEKSGIKNAAENAKQYPFEWSGGMLQRAGIVAAAAHEPSIIIADEPTSALDADRADQILKTLRKTNTAILLISHDINLVRRYADRIAVFREGRIEEIGETERVFENPIHEYTKLLLSCNVSRKHESDKTKNESVLEAKQLSKIYNSNGIKIHAVNSAGLTVQKYEIVGISGASGSGKSTLLRMLATIETPSSGEVFLQSKLATSGESNRLSFNGARKGFVMPIFQNPLSSLNKHWETWRVITEPLNAKHRTKKCSKAEKLEIARRILKEVGLSDVDLHAKPAKLSVGQCQRISIARALTSNPKLIAADEPTSALDARSAHIVMKLFRTIAEEGTAVIIVSHNEPLLRTFCDRVLQMHEGVLEPG